ncbi:MAG: T9SS type A sorting domain-containing protein [Lewinellaceae bacterium]|nr:T9SS type A sorting domain-containing protein [Lewinellaceae bacterium]MCB9290167.1 T9SS type A sorting domain-containing protein [Lewinellaceae bacterium]
MKVWTIKTAATLAMGTLMFFTSLKAQQVWPGDVNNNGVVNNIDVLFWAYAEGAQGPSRPVVSGDWAPQDPSEPWPETFPGGLNFAFADCDGNGNINSADLNIIKDNYWKSQDMVMLDEYFNGIVGQDPQLLLSTADQITEPGAEEPVGLSLGDEQMQIDSFFGMAFTLKFDTLNIKPTTNMGGNAGVQLDLVNPSWIHDPAGMGTNRSEIFMEVRDDNATAQVAIYRKQNAGATSGSGPVAEFTIVMEDIIVGLVDLETDSIHVVNNDFEGLYTAPSKLRFATAEDSLLLQDRAPLLDDKAVRLYPNPSNGWMTVELTDSNDEIQAIDLFNAQGALLNRLKAPRPASAARFDLGRYPEGLYVLRIKTRKGMLTKIAARMP